MMKTAFLICSLFFMTACDSCSGCYQNAEKEAERDQDFRMELLKQGYYVDFGGVCVRPLSDLPKPK